MSYSLAFAHTDIPDNDGEAWPWIDKAIEAYYEDDSPPHPKLKSLHDNLTKKFPCISTLPDDEIDDGVWSDGPLIDNFCGDMGMVAFSFSRTKEVLPFVIEQARALGITVFDHQTHEIHRP